MRRVYVVCARIVAVRRSRLSVIFLIGTNTETHHLDELASILIASVQLILNLETAAVDQY